MIFTKRKKVTHDLREIVPIVRDGAIATAGQFNGRLIPILRLDTAHRSDIADLIRIHSAGAHGDVRTQWGELYSSGKNVALFLSFLRPYETTVIIKFDILAQGIVVDGILKSKCVYIEAGVAGDVSPIFSDERPRLMLFLPDNGFDEIWPKLRYNALYARYRDEGLSRKDSKQAALAHADISREIMASQLKR